MEYGLLMVAASIFAVVLLICWIVLPFAIIGTKPLLRELIAEIRKTNALLQQLHEAAAPAVFRHSRDGS